MRQPMRILHLDENLEAVNRVQAALTKQGLRAEVSIATTLDQCLAALIAGGIDLMIVDQDVSKIDAQALLAEARRRCPDITCIVMTGAHVESTEADTMAQDKIGWISTSSLDDLIPVLRRIAPKNIIETTHQSEFELQPTDQLINAVQELSLARDLPTIMAIVRRAARALTGADGATFILRDGDQCFYADEDAIGPLWKGNRFPMSACISGWVMLHKEPAIISDIYADARIPAAAYRPTFVKSLAVVPIRAAAPVGAIGNYWAHQHLANPTEVKLLQALADSTSIAMENVQLYAELEQRVKDRTEQLQAANRELEAFSYSVSHDLRAPIRAIEGFSRLLLDREEALHEPEQDYLRRIHRATLRMNQLIDDLLGLSRISRAPLERQCVDLSSLAEDITAELRAAEPQRKVNCSVQSGIRADADPNLLRVVFENLLSNAWKYTSKQATAEIGFGRHPDNPAVYYVRDTGVGFDMAHASKLFGPFQRLHAESDFPGTGVGLATVQRIIHRHGGKIWVEASPGRGATFYFTLAETEQGANLTRAVSN